MATIQDVRQTLAKRLIKSNKSLEARALWIKQFDYDTKIFSEFALITYWTKYMNIEFAYDLLREKN